MIYLAGNPPGSGEDSPMINELITKFSDEIIIIIQKGIKKTNVPAKSINACFLGVSLEYTKSTLTC